MITKNISGTNLSANYATAVATSPRSWQVKLFSDGTELSCGIQRLTITKGSCGSTEGFSLGNVVSSMLTAELLELSTDIKNTSIEVQIGLDTGSMEWITIGHFMAIDVVKTAYSTSVTGYGYSIAKTSGSFVIPSTLSLANIASAITTATGCTITFDSGITTSYEIAGTIEAGASCYGGLQLLAHLCGGYAVDTYDGNFAIHRFDDTSTLSVATDRMKQLPNVEELAFRVTGVQVNATGQYTYALTTDVAIDPDKTYYTRSGTSPDYVYTPVEEPDVADIGTYYERFDVVYTSGTPVVLVDDNVNMSADIFNNIYAGIVGYSYKTGNIDLSIGDPRIEGNDVLTVTDVNGDTYTLPCHMVTHTYDGGLSTTVQAVKDTSSGDGIVSNAPISQRLDEIGVASAIAKASAESALADAESAKSSAQTALSNAQTALLNAQSAQRSADSAQTSANVALSSANSALLSLSQVEDVLDVLNWVAEHGEYQLTADTTIVSGKTYYTVVGTAVSSTVAEDLPTYYEMTGGHYVKTTDTAIVSGKTYYTVVGTPVTPDPSQIRSYYELVVSEAIANYISTHLALTDDGLYVMADNSEWKVLVASDGVYIIDPNGNIVAKYKDSIVIGKDDGTQSYQKLDYHSLQLIDKEGATYFHASDLRGLNGKATLRPTYKSINGSKTFDLPLPAVDTNYTVTVSDGSGGGITKQTTSFTFETAPSADATISVVYETADQKAKAFTLGTRQGTTGVMSVVEGRSCIASGAYSHAEGSVTYAKGDCSHSEGNQTEANGSSAHSEGYRTVANGAESHAEGSLSKAIGSASHAQGENTIASKFAQTALGKYNVEDPSNSITGVYAVIVGNGTNSNNRSNALAVKWDGDVEFAVNTSATTGVDADLYSALSALGWE